MSADATGRPPPLQVVAGALVDADGRVLIAARPPGKSFAGRWEFPGGKINGGETRRDALARELAEELGIVVGEAVPLLAVTYRYPGAAAAVHIDCWRVDTWRGQVESRDGQTLRWCSRDELADADMLEADRPIVTALRLPRLLVRIPATESQACDRDRVFIVDPLLPPAAGVGSVYAAAHAVTQGYPARALAGRVVRSAGEAALAATLDADFLLVPDGGLGAAELAAIAAVGLPWYLDVATTPPPDAAPPTGRLQWQASLPIQRR
jgi:8-oxo-dGTP diphosphatase